MPSVSIIVPCYNEQATIGLLLEALYRQDYPRQDMEVVIADGLSTDLTRQKVETFQEEYVDFAVRVVDNAERTIPTGLNQALQVAQGEFIVRLDAHSRPKPDYVRRCIEALQAGKGDNVGGIWDIQPGGKTWYARAIAAAAAHPLGAGDARYRLGGPAQPVDTVPFGAYRRDLVERVGYYDESLLTNEDYEFNVRIRQAGGKVWYDPAIRSTYFARPTLGALARQYWRYGYWKARMLKRYPHTLRWRQLLPPLFVGGLLLVALVSIGLPAARWILVAGLALYLAILGLAGIVAAVQRKDLALVVGLPSAVIIMHFTWGSAFLWSTFAATK